MVGWEGEISHDGGDDLSVALAVVTRITSKTGFTEATLREGGAYPTLTGNGTSVVLTRAQTSYWITVIQVMTVTRTPVGRGREGGIKLIVERSGIILYYTHDTCTSDS